MIVHYFSFNSIWCVCYWWRARHEGGHVYVCMKSWFTNLSLRLLLEIFAFNLHINIYIPVGAYIILKYKWLLPGLGNCTCKDKLSFLTNEGNLREINFNEFYVHWGHDIFSNSWSLRDTQIYLQYQTAPEGKENVCMSLDGI